MTLRLSLPPKVRVRVLILLISLGVLPFLLSPFFFDSNASIARGDRGEGHVDQQQDDQDANKPHWLVASYYTTKNGLSATLLLNNKGILPLEVRPIMYNLGGQAIEIQPLTLEAKSFRFVNLKDWAALGGESFAEGNIKLFHVGKDLVLGAQIYLTDEANSLSFEEKLAEVDKFDSRRLEGVWWLPSRDTEVQIILSNTTDTPLPISAQLSKRPHLSGTAHFFQLGAHETRVLNLRSDFIEGEHFARSGVIGLSLEHTGGKSALLARAMVKETANGYSNVVQFSNPAGAKSAEYHGVGFQIDDVGGERLTPIIVAKNVGPANGVFPSGEPIWSGTSGISGSGVTRSVTFSTVSSSLNDFKTVIATSGNSVTVNVIVYSLTGVFTPQDNFAGRSLTSFGPAEVIALSFTASPAVTATQAGGLLWKQTTGNGTLTAASDGTGSYTASSAAESVTLRLEVQDGPSKTLGPSSAISIIGPNAAYQVQSPGTGIKHVQGTCSAGFQAATFLLPKTVSFSHIQVREGSTTAVATGWLAPSNGNTHNAGSWFSVANCSVSTGCQIMALDTIYNEYPQNYGGPTWGAGDFQWDIPREWRVGTGTGIQFTSLLHHFVSDAVGKGTVSKGGAGPFSKNANDATSNF